MNYYDRQTLDLFYDADKYGLPYFEDELSLGMIRELKGLSLDDLVVIFALSRPNLRPDVWEGYKSGLWIDEVSMPDFTQGLLARSSGLLIFQEQLMDILRSTTGWSFDEANETRKLMGKKHQRELEPLYQEFISGLFHTSVGHQWLFRNRNEGGQALWNHLIECAPHLISYKFSLSCTLHSYQIAHNLTHQ
ncbi:MAG: hypothetical protein H6602_01290 [Flavobacteriales bacterium]|nr:hypothetical protein [Flavobacteriales bacterium]